MAVRRYARTPILKNGAQYGTSETILVLRDAIKNRTISFSTRILKEGERLDILAGQLWGDSTYYWIIAACSSIGWAVQCPPGTVLNIPDNLSDVIKLVG